MSVQVRHDGFARTALYRNTVPKGARKDCPWCGQPGRFQYQWQGDDSTRTLGWRSFPVFCSVSCWEAFSY